LTGDAKVLASMTMTILRSLDRLPVYQWLTAFPQVVSRIGHANISVYKVISKIILQVVRTYPLQSIWSLVSVSYSKKEERLARWHQINTKVRFC
jgi:serine/threonine-protein kinase ATR